jgi:CRISPR-associated protein Cas2
MSRQLYLVCYDISDDSTLQQVRQYLGAWRVQGQKSAMECWFTTSELQAAKTHLFNLIDLQTDRLHIVRLDPRQPVLHIGKHRDFDQNMGSFFIH